jgi:hypothetical protein
MNEEKFQYGLHDTSDLGKQIFNPGIINLTLMGNAGALDQIITEIKVQVTFSIDHQAEEVKQVLAKHLAGVFRQG